MLPALRGDSAYRTKRCAHQNREAAYLPAQQKFHSRSSRENAATLGPGQDCSYFIFTSNRRRFALFSYQHSLTQPYAASHSSKKAEAFAPSTRRRTASITRQRAPVASP